MLAHRCAAGGFLASAAVAATLGGADLRVCFNVLILQTLGLPSLLDSDPCSVEAAGASSFLEEIFVSPCPNQITHTCVSVDSELRCDGQTDVSGALASRIAVMTGLSLVLVVFLVLGLSPGFCSPWQVL